MTDKGIFSKRLFIDTPIPPKEGLVEFSVKTKEEAVEFISDVSGMNFPIYLDIQGCSDRVFGMLLSFIENYGGDLDVLATDPVPLSVLSRFNSIRVSDLSVNENGGIIESLLWRYQPSQIHSRMSALFS